MDRNGNSYRAGLVCRRPILLAIIALFAQFANVVMAAPTVVEPFKSSKGYTITPAKGWTSNSTGLMGTDVIIYARPVDAFTPNFNVVIVPTIKSDTLKGLPKQMRAMYPKTFTNYQFIGQRFSTLAGRPSYVTTGTYMLGTPARKIRLHQVMILHDGKATILTCTDTDKHYGKSLAAFDAMLKSVKWTEPAAESKSSNPPPPPAPESTEHSSESREPSPPNADSDPESAPVTGSPQ
jgi:hypothetical protein